jgi:hypothetical protein
MSRKAHTSWFPVGVITIILFPILFLLSLVAYNAPLGAEYYHPYRDFAFPMLILAICFLVVGVVSIWYDHTLMTMERKGVKS